jgi:hypothetical protein
MLSFVTVGRAKRIWPGLAERIEKRIVELGYENAARFADAKHYRVTYVYKWIAGTTPDPPTLDRLAKDLDTTPECCYSVM